MNYRVYFIRTFVNHSSTVQRLISRAKLHTHLSTIALLYDCVFIPLQKVKIAQWSAHSPSKRIIVVSNPFQCRSLMMLRRTLSPSILVGIGPHQLNKLKALNADQSQCLPHYLAVIYMFAYTCSYIYK